MSVKRLDKIHPEEMTSFEKCCSTCNGEGYVFRGQPSKEETCGSCGGRGVIANDLGSDLMKFLTRYS